MVALALCDAVDKPQLIITKLRDNVVECYNNR